MKAFLRQLRSELNGEIFDNEEALDYFATDGSIFTIRPEAVLYPKNAVDVSKIVSAVAEKAETSQRTSIVARGKGTDQAGGALGEGVMLAFPAHMNKILEMDKKSVTVQPGILYATLQKILHTHGRFLPPYPSSIDFSTIGGAVANNACGEKTIKYGATRDYVHSLKVVLADGKQVVARRISARELNRKKGQTDFEGEIYRKLDGLLADNAELIKNATPKTSKNAAGYNLWGVKGRDGSIDLSQVLVGSQGTLGVITEVTLKTMPYNPKTTLVVGYFDSLENAGDAVMRLQKLEPSALEIVDYYLLDFLRQNRPETIKGLVPDVLPKVALLVEFDDASQIKQTFKLNKAKRILGKLASGSRVAKSAKEQEALWAIRRSAAAVIWMNKGTKKALPIIEDGVVPVDKLPEFLDKTYKLLKKHDLEIAVWGHAGNANLHMQPFMDLSKPSDQAKIFELADEFYDMVIKMGGSTCGEHNDGLMRSPYLKKLYGEEVYDLFAQVKQIFDPQGILNPGKKIGVKVEDTKKLLRREYSMGHLYDHMPHS